MCLLTLIDAHLYILIAWLRNTEMVSHVSLDSVGTGPGVGVLWHIKRGVLGARAPPRRMGVLRTGLV